MINTIRTRLNFRVFLKIIFFIVKYDKGPERETTKYIQPNDLSQSKHQVKK